MLKNLSFIGCAVLLSSAVLNAGESTCPESDPKGLRNSSENNCAQESNKDFSNTVLQGRLSKEDVKNAIKEVFLELIHEENELFQEEKKKLHEQSAKDFRYAAIFFGIWSATCVAIGGFAVAIPMTIWPHR